MNTEVNVAARNDDRIPKWMVRAHRHVHGVVTDGFSLIAVTGAWQGLTRYGHKVVPSANPSPSVIALDWRGCQRGELPRVHEKVYEAKKKHIITVS